MNRTELWAYTGLSYKKLLSSDTLYAEVAIDLNGRWLKSKDSGKLIYLKNEDKKESENIIQARKFSVLQSVDRRRIK
ncbi:hypothetical protein K151_1940 [Proteus hauseri ZMd44]|uniref:hypothetical protein n=1 Tax=Proteus faecis TaxID=2050967 RepID=UPI0003C57537|nr:hypothetical protein K151_1940 [Proteus hauseri ZMd44]